MGSIPGRFMIGTISFTQSALAKVLLQEMDDPIRAVEVSGAWNKLLMVQLDVLLAGYMNERPVEPTSPTYADPKT